MNDIVLNAVNAFSFFVGTNLRILFDGGLTIEPSDRYHSQISGLIIEYTAMKTTNTLFQYIPLLNR